MSTSVLHGASLATDLAAVPAGDFQLPNDTAFLYASTGGNVQITFASGLTETFAVQAGDTLPFQRGLIVAAGTTATVRIAKQSQGHRY